MDTPAATESQSLRDVAPQESDADLLWLLKPSYRAILNMTGTYPAIAKTLSVAPGTVKSRLHRARAALVKLREKRALKGDAS